MTKRLMLSALLGLALMTAARADVLDDDLAAAKGLLLAGNVDDAAARLDSLEARARVTVTANPGDAHAQYILGMAAMYAGHDQPAKVALDLALRLDPNNVLYVLGRAQFAMYTDVPKDALPILQKALEGNAKNIEVLSALGEAQSSAGLFVDAQKTYQMAADLVPGEPRYMASIAEMLTKQGKADEALAAYEKALNIDPKYVPALAGMAQIHRIRKEYDKAVECLARIVAITPSEYRILAQQMQIYEIAGKTKERDAVREQIFALFKAGKIEAASYCREQFPNGTSNVMAFESFELKGPMAVRYAFNVVNADGKTVEKRISLGSYLSVTALARERGQIKADERMFHLDVYTEGDHEVLGMFTTEPTYEQTRDMVRRYFAGTLKPLPPDTAPATRPTATRGVGR
jgi:tetratricopeptide (TPR) repeat protein